MARGKNSKEIALQLNVKQIRHIEKYAYNKSAQSYIKKLINKEIELNAQTNSGEVNESSKCQPFESTKNNSKKSS